jgi:hypothetical protein
MGVDTRRVQRALERLRELGLVTKVKEAINKDKEREVCDLSGLVSKLAKIAETDTDCRHRIKLREETAN